MQFVYDDYSLTIHLNIKLPTYVRKDILCIYEVQSKTREFANNTFLLWYSNSCVFKKEKKTHISSEEPHQLVFDKRVVILKSLSHDKHEYYINYDESWMLTKSKSITGDPYSV